MRINQINWVQFPKNLKRRRNEGIWAKMLFISMNSYYFRRLWCWLISNASDQNVSILSRKVQNEYFYTFRIKKNLSLRQNFEASEILSGWPVGKKDESWVDEKTKTQTHCGGGQRPSGALEKPSKTKSLTINLHTVTQTSTNKAQHVLLIIKKSKDIHLLFLVEIYRQMDTLLTPIGGSARGIDNI